MWDCMRYYQDKDSGIYYVIRYRNGAALSTTSFGFGSAESAIDYIMAHGLIPHKISDSEQNV